MKKEEADKCHGSGAGYTCLGCKVAGSEEVQLNESENGAVRHLVQSMAALRKEICEQGERDRRWREEWEMGEANQLKCMLQRLTKVEEELQEERRLRKELEKQVQQLKEKVREEEKGQKEMEQKVKETVRKETASFADKLKANSTMQPGKVILKEVTERQDRGRNVVFRGVRESNEEEEDDRKTHDLEKLMEVAMKAGVDAELVQNSITRMRRLGRREEGKNFRPLLVRLTSSDVRERQASEEQQGPEGSEQSRELKIQN